MAKRRPVKASSPKVSATLPRALAGLAAVSALVMVVLMATRPLRSPDLGYHFAYGETFLETGRIVDHNDFLYTMPGGSQGGEVGPACWWDADGRYRFPNANWLSQVVMAAVHRYGGAVGMSVFQAALVAAIFAVMLVTMRRLAVPWAVIPAGVLLAAMTAYGRFNTRPEVFGYLFLSVQFCLLAGGRPGWRAVAALIVVQALFVNFHSYFLLAIGLTGAFLVDRLGRLAWCWMQQRPDADTSQLRRDAIHLAVVLAGQAVACFVNPWTWRLASLPIQTLLFIRTHQVAGADPTGSPHPWSRIGEFFAPFALKAGFIGNKATYGYLCLLAVAALGGIAAAAKRRWGYLLVIAGITAVSLSMRRNIATAAFIVTPVALAALCGALASVYRKLSARSQRRLRIGASGVLLLAMLCVALLVVTQRFYFRERSPTRFGLGYSRLNLPIDAGSWIRRHLPEGRIWSDYSGSSNFYYFTGGREVPIITNTWAYPPDVMGKVLSTSGDRQAFDKAAKEYGVEIAAIRVDPATTPLARHLGKHPGWIVVYLDGIHIIFVRKTYAAGRPGLIAITQETLDYQAHIDKLRSLDPLPAHGLYLGGLTMYQLEWDTACEKIFAAAIAEDPTYYQAWSMQGLCLARRGLRRLLTGDPRGKDDWLAARQRFQKTLQLKPDHKDARKHLNFIEQQLAALDQGVILTPQFR